MSGSRRAVWVLLFMLLLMNCSGYSQVHDSSGKLVIQKYAFCKKVEKREPVGTGKEFPADIGNVYLWMLVTGAEKPTKIRHVWYYIDKPVFTVTLDVRYQRTRTWSYKNITPESVGKWYVRVLDEDDGELGNFSFTVKESQQ